jgi:FkbM family methyltransferase
MGTRSAVTRRWVAAAKLRAFRIVASLRGEKVEVLRREVWRARALVDEVVHLYPRKAQLRRARAVATVLPLIARIPRLARRGLTLDLEVLGARHRLRLAQPSDLEVLGEVLGRDGYAVTGVEDARTVIDLGSHIGSSLLYFHARFPAARILGVEPDPRNWRLLAWNMAALPRVQTKRAAVTRVEGWRELNLAAERHSSSVMSGVATDRRVRVPAVTLDSLVAEFDPDRIDLLKIDIEGAEWEVLSSSAALERVDAVVGELHPPLLEPGVSERAVLALLSDFNLDVESFPAYGTTLFRGRRRPNLAART